MKESERFYVKDIIDDRLVILSSIMVSQKDDGIIATEIEKCINEYEGALFFLESSKNLTSMRKIYSDFCANSAAKFSSTENFATCMMLYFRRKSQI